MKYPQAELNNILKLHNDWLNNDGGKQADLSGANLSKANLSWANLSKADLSGADLSGADLSGADLSGADLSGANLSKANLSWADLSGADLSGADLSGADLSKANLSKANLLGASLYMTVWPLWCGSRNVKVDKNIATQLASHFCAVECSDAEYQEARAAILKFAQQSQYARALEIL